MADRTQGTGGNGLISEPEFFRKPQRMRISFSDLCIYVQRDPVASHVAAARFYHACRRAANTPRSSNDCLIARMATENSRVLLHNDRDFDAMASVKAELQIHA